MFFARLTAAALAFIVISPVARAADEPTTIRGSITRADTATGDVAVQTADGKTTILHVTKGTTVEVDGQAAKLADLTAGQRVRMTYRVADGRNEVVTLTARKTTGKDVAREAREALQAAKQYTFQQKAEYEKRLRQVVADLDDRIDDLEQRARESTADARKSLDQQVRDLKQKRAVVSERLEKVKAAGADAWDDLKTGVQKAVEDLQRALDRNKSDPNP
jgi:hypothetical protein